jgi:hypothetical protein
VPANTPIVVVVRFSPVPLEFVAGAITVMSRLGFAVRVFTSTSMPSAEMPSSLVTSTFNDWADAAPTAATNTTTASAAVRRILRIKTPLFGLSDTVLPT